MKKVLQLFKIQIDNSPGLLKTTSKKGFILSLFKILVILLFTTLALSFVFFRILVLGFRVSKEFIALILLITQSITLFFSVGTIITNLYRNEDNVIFMSLPVTPTQIYVSKIIFIYVKELILSTMITIPLMLALGWLGGLSLTFYMSLPILMVLLPIIPIIIASFISIPTMMVIRYLKNKTLLNIVFMLTFITLLVIAYLNVIGLLAGNLNFATNQLEIVIKVNRAIYAFGQNIFIYYQIALATFSFSHFYWLPIIFVVSMILFCLTNLLIKPYYFKAAMTNLETSLKTTQIGEKKFRQESVIFSLIRKEFYMIFRSPGYVFQFFLFTLLMPIMVYSYDKLMLSIVVSQAGENMIAGSHLLIVAMFAMLSNVVSASSISREGGNFYISKIVPVNYYVQILAKGLFNAVFTIGALFVTMLVCATYLNVLQVIVGTLAVVFASIGHIAYSLELDVKNPTLQWSDGEELTKVSGNTGKSIAMGLMVAIGMGFLIIAMAFNKLAYLPWLIVLILSIAFAINRIYTLILRINLTYDKIET